MNVIGNEWRGQSSGHKGGWSVFPTGSQASGPLCGGHTDHRQPAAVVAALQSRTQVGTSLQQYQRGRGELMFWRLNINGY